MIQRLQTLFLLVAVIFSCIISLCPFMGLISEAKGLFDSYALGVYQNGENIYGTWPLFVLSILNVLIGLCAIFMFKKRMIQVRLCTFNILLYIGFYIMLAFYVFAEKEVFSASATFKLPVILPLINIILTYLAIHRIRQDEELVRSMDRIR